MRYFHGDDIDKVPILVVIMERIKEEIKKIYILSGGYVLFVSDNFIGYFISIIGKNSSKRLRSVGSNRGFSVRNGIMRKRHDIETKHGTGNCMFGGSNFVGDMKGNNVRLNIINFRSNIKTRCGTGNNIFSGSNFVEDMRGNSVRQNLINFRKTIRGRSIRHSR